MSIKNELEEKIYDMEKVAQTFGIKPFEMYFLGGSACIIGEYNDRVTRDFDFIDLEYPARLGRVFSLLRDFDMLEYESTLISSKYKERANRIEKFKYLKIFVLSIEDIIVSKIIRLEKKDIEDIDILIKKADKNKINEIILEVLSRNDLYDSKKDEFKIKVKTFKEKYNV